jgi:hypothetical protein
MNAKWFNLAMPEVLRDIVKADAALEAQVVGGQANMNRTLVRSLIEQYREKMDEETYRDCLQFLDAL